MLVDMQEYPLYLHMLGTFSLHTGTPAINALYAPRLQALLALLILHSGVPQPRRKLAFCLWPDSREAQAQTNLRNLIYQLRHLLPEADTLMTITSRTIAWRRDAPLHVDVSIFEQSLNEAEAFERAGNYRAAQTSLEQALAWYHGDLLPTCDDEWILPERERLRQRFTHALAHITALLEAQKEYAAALPYAQRLLQAEPLQESAYLQLMRLQSLSGARAAALHTYQTCVVTLQRELAIEPGDMLQAAYASLVAQENLSPAPSLSAGRALIGRREEWIQLLACWKKAALGAPHMLLISGEAGIGKTRLADELLYWAERQGIRAARAQCFAAEGDLVYGPAIAWLSQTIFREGLNQLHAIWRVELARLAPELVDIPAHLPVPGPMTEPWQRRRLFEALTHAILSSEQPLLLVLDDLQHCDRDTLEWLHYLLRHNANSRLLLVALLRSEAQSDVNGLDALLLTLREQGQLQEMTLNALSPPETALLARHMAGQELTLQQTNALYQETEGNPLFVVEMMRASYEGWRMHTDTEHAAHSFATPSGMPPRIAAVMNVRLLALSQLARELVELAATIGRTFSFNLLAHASQLDDTSLVRGIDELWQRHILRERGDQEYDFSHDKLREVAYQQLSAARRRLLHQRVAKALEQLYAHQPDSMYAQVAMHYEQAACPEPALHAYQRAAEVSRAIFAHAEAISSYRHMLSVLDSASLPLTPGAIQELKAATYSSLGEVFMACAQQVEARSAYATAMTLVAANNVLARARLFRLLANSWRAEAQFVQAEQAYRQSTVVLEQLAAHASAAYWHEWLELQFDHIEASLWQGAITAVSAPEITQIQSITTIQGTKVQQVRMLLLRQILAFWYEHCGVDDDAMVHSDELIIASEAAGDPFLIIFSRWVAGQSRLLQRDFAGAEHHLHAALALAEQIGEIQLQSRCLVGLSLVARGRHQREQVQAYATRSHNLAATYDFKDILGAAAADQSWLAWCEHDLIGAAHYGQQALGYWQQSPIVFPFQWSALLPLIGVALAQHQLAEAQDYARQLLTATQQRLPNALETVLSQAATQAEVSYSSLQNGLALAQELGFL